MTVTRGLLVLVGLIALPALLVFPTFGAADIQAPTLASSTAGSTGEPEVAQNADQLSARISALIRQLGDDHYLARQAAQDELNRIGLDAYDELAAAENNTDIEVSSRAKYLLQLIRAQWIHDTDSPQVKRILDKYELLDESGRLLALVQLADLPQEIGLGPMCRLLRFEHSALVSKYTALLIISQPGQAGRSWDTRQKIIEGNLARNSGPGGQWLRAYLQFRRDPTSAAAEVDKLVDAELATLTPSSNAAERQNTLILERRLVDVLEQQFQRRDRAVDVLRRMVPVVANDQDLVSAFVDLLVQHRTWDLIDQLAHQGEGAFNTNPILIYTLAHSRRAEGKADEAKQLEDKAFKLIPENVDEHLRIARQLKRLGLFYASEQEFRHVIASAPQEADATIETQWTLADMLHDEQKDLEAAEVLKTMVTAMNREATVMQAVKSFFEPANPDSVAAQMHLYYACHYAAQKQRDQQTRELDEGAKLDPTNADILIGLYETSASDSVRRQNAMELIHAADKGFRDTIAQRPVDSTAYNQDAWLIGNTEGDYDLAIQYSEKSIELLKDLTAEETLAIKPGFLDTLAHCYAGKGDWGNAVKYQAQAAELDPHTVEISRALNEFKQRLEKKTAEKP